MTALGVIVTALLQTFTIGGGEAMPAEHGSVSVPSHRNRPGAPAITLRYVRFRSTAAQPGAPIVFLAGGPGDAATRAFAGMPRAFLDSLRARADVIAFDQRGTGTSEPRALCPPGAPLPLDRPLDPDALAGAVRNRLEACLPRLRGAGVDVEGLTTVESADDLEALRASLGVPRLTLLAGSYGTHLALAFARRHPGRLAGMALFGVEGPDHTLKLPSNVDAVLKGIDASHAGLLDSIRTLRERLRAAPWTKTLPNGLRVTVGEWDLQRRIAESLDTPREIDAMIAGVAGMRDGDYSDLVRWTIPFRSPKPLNVMNLAMDCASYASTARLARIRREEDQSLLGAAMNAPLPGICDAPGLPRLGDDFREPLTSEVPALLVSGTWDGRTPPTNAIEVAAAMKNARVVTIPQASHSLFQHPAALAALDRFLEGLTR